MIDRRERRTSHARYRRRTSPPGAPRGRRLPRRCSDRRPSPSSGLSCPATTRTQSARPKWTVTAASSGAGSSRRARPRSRVDLDRPAPGRARAAPRSRRAPARRRSSPRSRPPGRAGSRAPSPSAASAGAAARRSGARAPRRRGRAPSRPARGARRGGESAQRAGALVGGRRADGSPAFISARASAAQRDRPAKAVALGERLPLGEHRLRLGRSAAPRRCSAMARSTRIQALAQTISSSSARSTARAQLLDRRVGPLGEHLEAADVPLGQVAEAEQRRRLDHDQAHRLEQRPQAGRRLAVADDARREGKHAERSAGMCTSGRRSDSRSSRRRAASTAGAGAARGRRRRRCSGRTKADHEARGATPSIAW